MEGGEGLNEKVRFKTVVTKGGTGLKGLLFFSLGWETTEYF